MTYSVELAYLDYFRNASIGLHDSTHIKDRLKVAGLAAGTALVGGLKTVSRVITFVIEIVKVIFYSLASIFSLGSYGNLNRLKDHCKLLTLNIASLIGQPLQVIIHSLAIVIGIISPKAAYRTMQIGIIALAWITSHENGIWQQYKAPRFYTKVTETLMSKIRNVFNQCPFYIQSVMKTIVSEFSCALDSAFAAPIGYMDQFHSFGANPKTLTDEQKKLTPILLLNGNYSHQGTFLPLLYALQLSNNQRPVYTINLPPNTIEPSFIVSKIEAIKNQYEKANEDQFEMDLIGHSMGANLIQNICCRSNEAQAIQIRRAVTIGSPFFSQPIANIPKASFDIIGTKDCLNQRESVLQKERQIKIKTGHLGLLFHRNSLNSITKLLS